jgi:hypothetical protein
MNAHDPHNSATIHHRELLRVGFIPLIFCTYRTNTAVQRAYDPSIRACNTLIGGFSGSREPLWARLGDSLQRHRRLAINPPERNDRRIPPWTRAFRVWQLIIFDLYTYNCLPLSDTIFLIRFT